MTRPHSGLAASVRVRRTRFALKGLGFQPDRERPGNERGFGCRQMSLHRPNGFSSTCGRSASVKMSERLRGDDLHDLLSAPLVQTRCYNSNPRSGCVGTTVGTLQQ
jgi:hypothetical protein